MKDQNFAIHQNRTEQPLEQKKKTDGQTDQSLPKSPSKEGAACFCILFGMSYYCNLNNWTNQRPTNRTMNRTSRHKKSVIGGDGGIKSHNKQLWAKRHHSYRFYKAHVNSFPLPPSKQTYFSFCLKWSLLFCSFYNLKLSLSLSIFLLNLDKSPAKISVFFFFRPGEEKKTRKQSHINKKLERDWKEKHFKYYVVWRNMNDQAQHRVFKRQCCLEIYNSNVFYYSSVVRDEPNIHK